jgi:hypothetical protein
MGSSTASTPSTTGTSIPSQYVQAGSGGGGCSVKTRGFGAGSKGGGAPAHDAATVSDSATVAIAPLTIGANASLPASAATITVSFAKDNRRRFNPGRARFVLPHFVASPLVRVMVLAIAGVIAAAWALASHSTRHMPPLLRPVDPAPAATYDADAGEVPVPDIYLGDGG